jgi:hypothetical protein
MEIHIKGLKCAKEQAQIPFYTSSKSEVHYQINQGPDTGENEANQTKSPYPREVPP